MPPKPTARARTWGTRFDTLDPSPPPTPATSDTTTNVNSATYQGASVNSQQDTPMKKKDDRMPHDASVFVGSLPTNVEPQELNRLLSARLSEHAEVKSVKVIRDAKGGVCAFVQCEDAVAAGRLIQTLQSLPQEPFLGRYLRFEPARAFRTLLVSYRTPTRFGPTGAKEGSRGGVDNKENRTIELPLPSAIRLYKPRGYKYTSVLYNEEARHFDPQATSPLVSSHSGSTHEDGARDAFGGDGFLVSPLKFDAEAIRKIAEAFGPVETFGPYKAIAGSGAPESPINNNDSKTYPFPHDAPRSSAMDEGCWEIKWEQRDDCVSALMTLRRVAFLTVTWAHQQSSSMTQDVYTSPLGLHRARFPSANGTPYPYHVQVNRSPSVNGGDYRRFGVQSSGMVEHVPPRLRTATASSDTTILSFPSSRHSSVVPFNDGVVTQGSAFPTSLSMDGLGNLRVGIPPSDSARPLDWSEQDFPPLGNNTDESTTGSWDRQQDDAAETGIIGTIMPSVSEPAIVLAVGHHQQNLPTHMSLGAQQSSAPSSPSTTRSPITPVAVETTSYKYNQMPIPSATMSDLRSVMQSYGSEMKEDNRQTTEHGLDPTTVFIGGLETYGPSAWDEDKVKSLFEQYGGIESVRVVHPPNKRSGFAFVKFDNTESPARAVAEQHNQVYEGRQIRVQLRDTKPALRGVGGFRYGLRGRGRYYNYMARPDSHAFEARISPEERRYGSGIATSVSHEYFATSRGARATGGSSPKDNPVRADAEHTSPPAEIRFPSINEPAPSPPESDTSNDHQACQETTSTPDSVTPPPSSVGSSVSVAGANGAYAVPPMAFYAPPPWMSAFGQPYPYPFPYVPGYPLPTQQAPPSYPTTPSSSDASGPTAGAPPCWIPQAHVYRPFMPYPPYSAVSPNGNTQPSQQALGLSPPRPSGFIQNEQGLLVPIYQPDVLGQAGQTIQDTNPSNANRQDAEPAGPKWPVPHDTQQLAFPLAFPLAAGVPPHPHYMHAQMGAQTAWSSNQPTLGLTGNNQGAPYGNFPSSQSQNVNPGTQPIAHQSYHGPKTFPRREPYKQQQNYNNVRNPNRRPSPNNRPPRGAGVNLAVAQNRGLPPAYIQGPQVWSQTQAGTA